MKTNLLFDFTVDKQTHTITVTREFEADLSLVWDAFTRKEIIDQWVAPKPWRAQTKEMDFREGGRWLYAMISPEGVYHWSLVNFLKVEDKTSFTSRNSFCDENGNPKQTGFTSSITTTSFTAQGETTTVQIVKKMASLDELEGFIAMGYKEGIAMTMTNLENLLVGIMNDSEK